MLLKTTNVDLTVAVEHMSGDYQIHKDTSSGNFMAIGQVDIKDMEVLSEVSPHSLEEKWQRINKMCNSW